MFTEKYSYNREDQKIIKEIIDNNIKCIVEFSNIVTVFYIDNHEEIELNSPSLLINRHRDEINELWGCGNGLSLAKRRYIDSVCNNYEFVF
jgi:hypothetical protein